MIVAVTDWDFSTAKPCDYCGERPEDYWHMARIEAPVDGLKYKMIWVCMTCLGNRVGIKGVVIENAENKQMQESNSKDYGTRDIFIDNYFKDCIEIINQIDRKQIIKISEILNKIKQNEGRLFILGVGGSAANASHAVNDFRKIAGIESYSPTDNVSELSARTNDDGWETVFINWLKVSRLNSKDSVLVLSVSGGDIEKNVSVNIVKALEYAKEIGANIMGIVGRDGGYVAKVTDAYVIIPTVNNETITPHTEAFQSIICHLLVSSPDIKRHMMKWEITK